MGKLTLCTDNRSREGGGLFAVVGGGWLLVTLPKFLSRFVERSLDGSVQAGVIGWNSHQ